MEEPAGIPSTRCKTSLASIYGLMSETSPAFHLPVSPLVRSLLDDTNLALSKFLEDRTVFCPCLVAIIESTTVPPLPLFRDCTQSHLVLPPSPSRKRVRLGNVPFPCPPHRSPLWKPCFPGFARSHRGWTGGCRRAGVSGSIYRTRFVPTSNGWYSLGRGPWNSWLARVAQLLEISFFRDEIPCSPTSVLRFRRRK